MYSINTTTKQLEYPWSNGIEYYIRNQNKDIYIATDHIEKYAFNYREKKEIVVNAEGTPYYGKYIQKEIYPVDLNKDFEYFINVNNEDRYCTNNYLVQFYPLDFTGRQKVARNQTGPFYALDNKQQFYYPINEFMNEFAVQNNQGAYMIITSKTGHPIVPQKRNGTVNYLKENDPEIPYSLIMWIL